MRQPTDIPLALAIAVLAMLALMGCSTLDYSYDRVTGVVDRAMSSNLQLNGADTGKTISSGVPMNDALVVTWGADLARLWDLRIAQFNGASIGAAITQATMAAAISGVAIGQGPVAAAGGIAAASLFFQHLFGIANTPAKANAYLGGRDLLVNAENEYWLSLRVDACGETKISGTELTDAGAQYLVRINNAAIVVQKAIQMTIPTAEQMQAATVPAGDVRDKIRALNKPCTPDASGKLRRTK